MNLGEDTRGDPTFLSYFVIIGYGKFEGIEELNEDLVVKKFG